MIRWLLLFAACTACAHGDDATSSYASAPLAIVGAESALGYASAIALGKHNAVAVHNTHGLTSLQLGRILHLRELGIVTLAVDFTDLGHVYRFNSSVSAGRVALFADVGDEHTFEYLLAARRGLQEIEDMREGERRMAVECFATDMRLSWLREGYCREAPLVESALPPAPQLACQASGTCKTVSLLEWGVQLSKLFNVELSLHLGNTAVPQVSASLQSMLQRFPDGCDTDSSKCEPLVMEYMRTDYAEVSYTGSMSMERRHKYSRPSAGFFEFPCGMLGPTPFDLDEDGWANLTSHCETVVVTAIFGGTDVLMTPSEGDISETTCHFAFLDSNTAEAHFDVRQVSFQQYSDTMWVGKDGVWTVVILRPNHKSPYPFANPRRTSRIPKLLPHRLFPKAKHIIWIDANKRIRRGTIQGLLDNTLGRGEHPIAFPTIKWTRSTRGESKLTRRMQLEDARTIQTHDQVHELTYKDVETDSIMWGGVIVRDNTDLRVHWHSCLWFNDWARYSQRDQVSLIQTLKWSGLQSRAHRFLRQSVIEIEHKHRHGIHRR